MSRVLKEHEIAGFNSQLLVVALDESGFGNACHQYQIRRFARNGGDETDDIELCGVRFQNGPVNETGVNGISNEALLAIVADRLIGFQAGQYACRENAIALTKIQEAIMWLNKRTSDRLNRGVEGTHKR